MTITRIVQIRLGLSNAYLVLGERPILVDTGSPGEVEHIVAALKQANVAPRDLALILHTHGHVDHAGTTRALQAMSGAPVAIHRADAGLLRRGENGLVTPSSWLGYWVRPFVVKPFEAVEPDIVLEAEGDLSAYGVQARLVFTPGHTTGSLSILTDADEAIVGDLLMGGFTNGAFAAGQPEYHFFINDRAALHASLRRVVALAPAKVHVGHGGPLTLAKIKTRFVSVLS
jgi:glyoxylase-like metal-dependent hydrolase (beta-lactamase superfamily II)